MKTLNGLFSCKGLVAVVKPILEAVITCESNAVLVKQREVLGEMKRRGVLDAEKLVFQKQRFSSIPTQKEPKLR